MCYHDFFEACKKRMAGEIARFLYLSSFRAAAELIAPRGGREAVGFFEGRREMECRAEA